MVSQQVLEVQQPDLLDQMQPHGRDKQEHDSLDHNQLGILRVCMWHRMQQIGRLIDGSVFQDHQSLES